MRQTLKDREVQETLKKIESIQNAIDNPMYNLQHQESIKLDIRINNKLEHAKFVPHPSLENVWYATAQTFSAMKKNIFALSEQSIDIQDLIECNSCKKEIDKQFWHFCPHCASEIK